MKVENSSLAKAAVGKPSSQMRNEQLFANVRSTFFVAGSNYIVIDGLEDRLNHSSF